ncbi:MAG: MvaI/BcnI restriction endonuclease family protein [Magnetococcales bacterium]|nr:MvaI/BcnI restriction endonuclease family protein [Nitrospirota bacterium]
MNTYTKEQLINKLISIKDMGWIRNARPGNAGGIGNTLEDLLGIKENNLPIPNASEWELKCQRLNSSSLTTLFHMEPSPRALKFVPQVLLLKYGWSHHEAGKKYLSQEMSFRQTIHGKSRSDRGFMVTICHPERKVLISFDAKYVSERHSIWLESVKDKIGLRELEPQPYWGFDDLFHKAGTKLLNCFYIQANAKHEGGVEYFSYEKIMMLQKFSLDRFLEAIENAAVLIDFDARTGHNHGTKFRLRQDKMPELYEHITVIA